MRIVDPILMELEQEAQTTRRVLERVPDRQAGVAASPLGEDAWTARPAHCAHARYFCGLRLQSNAGAAGRSRC